MNSSIVEVEEKWLPVNEFPMYEISSLGRVKNITTGKMLKNNLKSGYYHVALTNSTGKKIFKVHRLVAQAFISNPKIKQQVNHLDKNKLNNKLENLEWATASENMTHCFYNHTIIDNKKQTQIHMINKHTDEILKTFVSFTEAAEWAVIHCNANNTHSARNAISNCACGRSNTAFKYKWQMHQETSETNEIWKEVECSSEKHPKVKYYVSNLGRFKNSRGITPDDKYIINIDGYVKVYMRGKTYSLHRLVALTFIKNPDPINKTQVNHIDGNKLNNCITNLEWTSCSENNQHKFDIGLGNNFTRKVAQLTLDGQLVKIHNSIVLAAKEAGVSKSCISGVLRKYRKTSAGFIWKYAD